MLTAEERERLHRARWCKKDANERARMNRELNAEKESQDELFYRQFWCDVYIAAIEQGHHAAGWADVALKDLKARSFK